VEFAHRLGIGEVEGGPIIRRRVGVASRERGGIGSFTRSSVLTAEVDSSLHGYKCALGGNRTHRSIDVRAERKRDPPMARATGGVEAERLFEGLDCGLVIEPEYEDQALIEIALCEG